MNPTVLKAIKNILAELMKQAGKRFLKGQPLGSLYDDIKTVEAFVYTPPPAPITEAEEQRRGEEIANTLKLKQARDSDRKRYTPPRYDTGYGNKTALGLYRTLKMYYDHPTRVTL